MKQLFKLILIFSVISCNSNPKHNSLVSAKIKGLQKGTVYLQKFQDTVYMTLDSLDVKEKETVQLGCQLDEPEVLYLSLSKAKDAERIQFFAEVGTTTIDTNLKQFVFDAKIEGSKQQKLLQKYRSNLVRFKNAQLDLLEASINAQRAANQKEYEVVQNKMDKNLKRQYLYSINYAINNSDNEVAPYIALADVYDLEPKFLDTIYNSLSPRVAASKYGVLLKDYLNKVSPEKE